jgi:hypothetical protein
VWECGCCVGKRGHEAEFCLCTQDGAGLTVPRCCTSLSSQQQPPSFCLQVHGLKEACAAVRAAGRRVVVATPRILKPDEQRLWLFYLRLNADALLLRRWGIGPKLFCCYCYAGGVWGGCGRFLSVLTGFNTCYLSCCLASCSAGLLQHLMELGGPGACESEAQILGQSCLEGLDRSKAWRPPASLCPPAPPYAALPARFRHLACRRCCGGQRVPCASAGGRLFTECRQRPNRRPAAEQRAEVWGCAAACRGWGAGRSEQLAGLCLAAGE